MRINPKRNILLFGFKVALLVVALALSMECSFRYIGSNPNPIPLIVRNPTAKPLRERPKEGLFTYSADYIYRLSPNLMEEYIRSSYNGGDRITWQTDQQGNRGKKRDKEYERHILVFGDSNIQARFSKYEDTFCFQLESEMSDDKEPPKVVNLGTIGFGPDQNLIRLKKEFTNYNPRLIIFHVFADNDFGDIVRNQLIDVDQQGRMYRTEVDPRALFVRSDQIRYSFKELNPITLHLETLDYLHASMALNGRFERLKKEFSLYKQRKPLPNILLDHYDLDIATNPEGEIAKYKIALMKAIFIELKKFSVQKNVPIVLLFQPSSVDMSTNSSLNYLSLQNHFEDYVPKNQISTLERLADEVKIDFVSLWEPFLSNNPNKLYFKGINNHWNDDGQKLAAKEVSQYIQRQGW